MGRVIKTEMNPDALKQSFDLLKAGARLPDKYNHELRGWRLHVLNSCKAVYYLGIASFIVWAISRFMHG